LPLPKKEFRFVAAINPGVRELTQTCGKFEKRVIVVAGKELRYVAVINSGIHKLTQTFGYYHFF